MTIYRSFILALWLVFVVYWLVSAIGAKKSIGGSAWLRRAGLRLVIILLILLAARTPALRHVFQEARVHAVNTSALMGVIGVLLTAVGVGIAIWARVHIGRNWGMPMSRKEHPELVTTGPYAFVRHPIYAGILLATLGSAIGESVFWLVPFVIAVAYFTYSAWHEEKLMTDQFPDQYPEYQRRTKMLVPFVV